MKKKHQKRRTVKEMILHKIGLPKRTYSRKLDTGMETIFLGRNDIHKIMHKIMNKIIELNCRLT